ncbi:MAG: hypothetical protein MUO68_16190, partial [Desulfobacteraceae bacterium]|nr:hypothetical protein [Desulfobacteraceae bacterium]
MRIPNDKIAVKKDRLHRFIFPVLIVLAVMCFSKIFYNVSWKIDSPQIHWLVAFISGLTLNLSITFGASVVYPLAYFNGARPVERIIACLITPLVWNGWEIIRVTEFFTLGESLYYGL